MTDELMPEPKYTSLPQLGPNDLPRIGAGANYTQGYKDWLREYAAQVEAQNNMQYLGTPVAPANWQNGPAYTPSPQIDPAVLSMPAQEAVNGAPVTPSRGLNTPFNPTFTSAPLQAAGNPFAAAAKRAGFSDFQNAQAAALRGASDG